MKILYKVLYNKWISAFQVIGIPSFCFHRDKKQYGLVGINFAFSPEEESLRRDVTNNKRARTTTEGWLPVNVLTDDNSEFSFESSESSGALLFVNILTQRDWIQSVISGDQDKLHILWPTNAKSDRVSNKASCTLEPSFFIIWTYFIFMYKNDENIKQIST